MIIYIKQTDPWIKYWHCKFLQTVDMLHQYVFVCCGYVETLFFFAFQFSILCCEDGVVTMWAEIALSYG